MTFRGLGNRSHMVARGLSDRQLNQRLRFHDRTVFWERVKSMDQQAAWKQVGLEITDGSGCESIRRRKHVAERGLAAIGAKLLVQSQIDFRINPFDLIAQVISDFVWQAEKLVAIAA